MHRLNALVQNLMLLAQCTMSLGEGLSGPRSFATERTGKIFLPV